MGAGTPEQIKKGSDLGGTRYGIIEIPARCTSFQIENPAILLLSKSLKKGLHLWLWLK